MWEIHDRDGQSVHCELLVASGPLLWAPQQKRVSQIFVVLHGNMKDAC